MGAAAFRSEERRLQDQPPHGMDVQRLDKTGHLTEGVVSNDAETIELLLPDFVYNLEGLAQPIIIADNTGIAAHQFRDFLFHLAVIDPLVPVPMGGDALRGLPDDFRRNGGQVGGEGLSRRLCPRYRTENLRFREGVSGQAVGAHRARLRLARGIQSRNSGFAALVDDNAAHEIVGARRPFVGLPRGIEIQGGAGLHLPAR